MYMKKVSLFLLGLFVALMASAEIRVLSDVKLGEGFFPRFADAETVTYLLNGNADYFTSEEESACYVDNENLDLNLYRNGEKVVLNPHGDVNYIWTSLSPNKKMILFNTKFGTAICDLDGKEIINLGQDLDAPVWYGNDYVVGMDDNHDGYYNVESSIMIASVDGNYLQRLTSPEGMGMYPAVDASSGRIVYNTEDGDIRMLQINLTEEPIRKELPRLVQQVDATLLHQMQRQAKRAASTNPADYKIYINPGHGGYGGDDRGMYLYPIFINGQVNTAAGYTKEQTFWESQSNLDKGLRLDTMLRALGFQTMLSRIYNTEDDDRSLSAIAKEASDWKADFMLSIHSNAGNPSNYILQIHSGITPGDPYGLNGYPEKVPEWISNEARTITTLMGSNQYKNEVSCWSKEPTIAGDKTFARTIMGWSNGYGVLRNLKVPGTISEGMMHDYLPETYRLVNIDYKRQESFYFAKTFIEHFCDGELPYGAIGGKIHDDYQKQVFPDYRPRKNSRDVFRPILKGVVELWQNGEKIDSYTTDTLYNGCYFFWDLKPGEYVVKAVPEGYYPQEDTVVVENNKISYAIFALSLMRQTPPEVIDYSPKVALTDSVQVSTPVTITFNWDMHEELTTKAFSITPAVDGAVTYEDGSRRLVFTPTTRFEPGVEYTVTVSTEASHPDFAFDHNMKEAFSFKFRTMNRGSVRVSQTYPVQGNVNVPLTPSFIALFDAKIINKTAQDNVGVLDANGNALKINSRSFKYNKAPGGGGHVAFELIDPLAPNSDYTLQLYPAISDVDGVLLNETISIAFQTGDAVEPSIPMANPLDSLFFVGDKESSVGASSVSTIRYTSKKMEGQASNKLAYTYNEANGEAHYVAKNLTAYQGNSESMLGMYVFADYSFNTLYAKWAVDGDIQYTKICDLDYAGWLYQEADMSSLPSGVDYQFMGLKLVRQSSVLSETGEFCVDALRIVFKPSVGAGLDQVDMQENANCKYIENGHLHILFNGVEYNAEGKVIK